MVAGTQFTDDGQSCVPRQAHEEILGMDQAQLLSVVGPVRPLVKPYFTMGLWVRQPVRPRVLGALVLDRPLRRGAGQIR